MSNPISNYLGVHAAALPLREQRMQLIASNLSNADTPNFKAKEENFATRNTNGTGPYKITGWQPEQKLTMAQNKAWWDDKNASNVTEVLYSPIKNDQTRIAALLSGEVDLLTDVPTQDVMRLKGDAKYRVMEGNEVRTIFIAMDQGSDQLKGSSVQGNPLKDKQVREALSLAIDRHGIQRAIMRRLSLPAATLLAPGVNGHIPQLDAAPRADPERAKKLFAEAD